MTATDEKLGSILGRRSIRAYTRDPVSDEAVQKLLEAAISLARQYGSSRTFSMAGQATGAVD